MAHEQYQQLLQTLHECMTECNHCYDACLKEDDIKMMAECIRLDRECADICAYLEQAISRGTPFVSELASVCATICEACGNECKNIIMITVKNVLMPALNAQKHVEVLLKNIYSVKNCSKQVYLPI